MDFMEKGAIGTCQLLLPSSPAPLGGDLHVPRGARSRLVGLFRAPYRSGRPLKRPRGLPRGPELRFAHALGLWQPLGGQSTAPLRGLQPDACRKQAFALM